MLRVFVASISPAVVSEEFPWKNRSAAGPSSTVTRAAVATVAAGGAAVTLFISSAMAAESIAIIRCCIVAQKRTHKKANRLRHMSTPKKSGPYDAGIARLRYEKQK